MKYLNSIANFLKRKKPNKTVKYFLDIINNQYNLKKIDEHIFSNKDRYDFNFTIERVYEISIYEKGKQKESNRRRFDKNAHCSINDMILPITNLYQQNLVLFARYIFWYISLNFNNLNEYSLVDGTYGVQNLVIGNNGSKVYSFSEAIDLLDVEADFAIMKVIILWSGPEPDDIMLDAFEFMIKKYGFEFENKEKKIYHDDDRNKKVLNLVKLIDPNKILDLD